jgi:hypothetical protein
MRQLQWPVAVLALVVVQIFSGTGAASTGSCAKSQSPFTTIEFPGATFLAASGINGQGDIVGRYVAAGITHGFLLSDGVIETIEVPGATFTAGRSVRVPGRGGNSLGPAA